MRRMAASSPSPPKATRPRRWLRFSLRGLMIFLTLACVGVWYWFRVPYREEITHAKQQTLLFVELPVIIGAAKEVRHYRRVLRGDPIREGLTEYFDHEGQLVGQETWREGQLHGPFFRWYSSGRPAEAGQYHMGQKDGTWERFDPEGKLLLRMSYDRGYLHGAGQWFANGQALRTIVYEHGEVKQIDGRRVDDPLGRALRNGQIDEHDLAQMFTKRAEADFQQTPLKDVADYISEDFNVNVALDQRALREAKISVDLPINLQERHLTAGTVLVVVCEPHGLLATYRFGMIWITTKKDAKNWADRTGIAELLKSPPADVMASDREKVRAAFEQRAEFDFIDTPLQDVAEFVSEIYRVPLASEPRIKDIPVISNLRGVSLQNALGALCDQYGLRVRWVDGKTLLIEPQEGAERWRPRH
jgi:MORN repeat protein